MRKTDIIIANRKCHIYEGEKAEFLLVQPIDEHDLEVLDKEVEAIAPLTRKAFTFVALDVKNWQEDLTPWSAPAVFGKTPFGDGAAQTLRFITTELISSLKEMSLFDEISMKCLLGGYSLAALFSLWAGYNCMVSGVDRLCIGKPASSIVVLLKSGRQRGKNKECRDVTSGQLHPHAARHV